MFALFINGGEVTRFLGVHSNMLAINDVIKAQCKEAGYDGEEWRHTDTAPQKDKRETHTYVHEDGEQFDESWVLLFTIVGVIPGEVLDVELA